MTTTPDQERAAIVAWLRKEAAQYVDGNMMANVHNRLADEIERGDHKGE